MAASKRFEKKANDSIIIDKLNNLFEPDYNINELEEDTNSLRDFLKRNNLGPQEGLLSISRQTTKENGQEKVTSVTLSFNNKRSYELNEYEEYLDGMESDTELEYFLKETFFNEQIIAERLRKSADEQLKSLTELQSKKEQHRSNICKALEDFCNIEGQEVLIGPYAFSLNLAPNQKIGLINLDNNKYRLTIPSNQDSIHILHGKEISQKQAESISKAQGILEIITSLATNRFESELNERLCAINDSAFNSLFTSISFENNNSYLCFEQKGANQPLRIYLGIDYNAQDNNKEHSRQIYNDLWYIKHSDSNDIENKKHIIETLISIIGKVKIYQENQDKKIQFMITIIEKSLNNTLKDLENNIDVADKASDAPNAPPVPLPDYNNSTNGTSAAAAAAKPKKSFFALRKNSTDGSADKSTGIGISAGKDLDGKKKNKISFSLTSLFGRGGSKKTSSELAWDDTGIGSRTNNPSTSTTTENDRNHNRMQPVAAASSAGPGSTGPRIAMKPPSDGVARIAAATAARAAPTDTSPNVAANEKNLTFHIPPPPPPPPPAAAAAAAVSSSNLADIRNQLKHVPAPFGGPPTYAPPPPPPITAVPPQPAFTLSNAGTPDRRGSQSQVSSV